jgi:cell division inhibitor SulA
MQFPLSLNTVQTPLFESVLAHSLPFFLPEPEDISLSFSELSLRGASGNCLHLLAPILRELSQAEDSRWLTLIAPPATLTQQWLRETGMHRERILLLQPRGEQSAIELSCDALRLGRSHTVVSWLKLERHQCARLAKAAHAGRTQSLNICLE